jgi:cyclophilin family peptidyl-prolyl cis-trans isomerase/protein-disulfide isomerase
MKNNLSLVRQAVATVLVVGALTACLPLTPAAPPPSGLILDTSAPPAAPSAPAAQATAVQSTAVPGATGAAATPSAPTVTPPPTPTYTTAMSDFSKMPDPLAGWVIGDPSVPITIVEYSDFQCPYCAAAEPALEQILKDAPQDIKLVYHEFPLMQLTQSGQPFHDKAQLAAEAAEAAGAQGKFWEMHHLLFTNQTDWSGMAPADFPAQLDKYAAQIGLDLPRFKADIGSQGIAKRVQAAFDQAGKMQLQGTPTVFINDKPYQMALTPELLRFAIKLTKEGVFGQNPGLMIDPASPYTATIATTKGTVVLALDAAKAPQTVNSFVFLARHGWYDNTPFLVVTPKFVIAGDPGQTNGFPGYTTGAENNAVDQAHAGMVGMFPLDQQGQYFGSLFFIARDVLTSTTGLPFFGQVVSGSDTLAALEPKASPQVTTTDVIQSITIEGPIVTPKPTAVPTPAKQWTAEPAMQIDANKSYTATLHTAKGDVVIQLLPKIAPHTVNSFVFLARQGFYDGVTFHRVLPGFMAQGGDPTGTGTGGPGYQFQDEITTTVTFDGAGVVAMANAGPNTNGSQFFITYAAQPSLNGHYSIFGKVVAGMDAVLALSPRDPGMNPTAPPGDAILSVTIEEK